MDALAQPFGAGLGPWGQTLVIPALAALIVAAVVRAAGGRAQAALAAGLGLGAAQLAIAWAIGGAPRFPNPAAVDKLALATPAFALIAAGLLKRGRLEPRAIVPMAALIPVVWIAWPFLTDLTLARFGKAVLAFAIAGAIAYGLSRAEARVLPGIVAALAAGLGGVAVFGATFRMGQLSGGLAVGALVAPLGVLAAGGASGGLGAAVAGAPFRAAAAAGLSSAAAILVLFTPSEALALALLVPALFADDLARRLPGGGAAGAARHIPAVAAIALLSAGAAVLWAQATGGTPYYG
ncbi:MAG: hypothetical protein RIB45_15780 [Marivibrio sp.]|uniref:hypothetical protein n=1 Tax=Marivibrio sp. TaxID=2039719 RepID=UPI0032F07EB7